MVEVEFVGVRGCTRRPVLDFRPTVGVIVAACAGPAASVAPRWQVASRRVLSAWSFMGVRQSWVPVWLSAMRSLVTWLVGVSQWWVYLVLSAMRSLTGRASGWCAPPSWFRG